MALAPGTGLGPYEITGLIGAGGMGEVYRATDAQLGRDVAIKVLPDAFAQDSERLARFEREARTLASLSHPNITIVYGFEKATAASGSGQVVRALVMELVEGPTLADRIAQGPIPIDEALPIAKQIAEAIEAAHEQGVIHRDLKPANVKAREDGTVKVLDFGLAKMMEASGAGGVDGAGGPGGVNWAATISPTITTPAMTQLGMILGTAAYMAPEQARGKLLDKRTDIWAFGCVLFEMLAGTRAFDGEDATDTIAAVVRAEPKWDALPSDVPPHIRLLLRRCLEKDRKKRIGDISTALFIMQEQAAVPIASAATAIGAAPPRQAKWRYLAWSALAVAVASAVVAGSVWMSMRPDPPRVSRLELVTSGQSRLADNAQAQRIAISRDGSRVIYVAGAPGGIPTLLTRRIDQLDVGSLLPGVAPFVRPDGRWIGFFSQGWIRKVEITGGPSIGIARYGGSPVLSATWGSDDTIVFGTFSTTGLFRVSAAGGEPVALTRLDRTKGEANHVWPRFLPDGRGVLFTILTGVGSSNAQVAVLDLRTPSAQPRIIIRGGSDARYLPTGHLVYVAAGSLRAVPFDLDRLEVKGDSVPVIASVATILGTGGLFDVADDGTLVYSQQTETTPLARTLAWVDRHGKEEAISAPPRAYQYPRISPEGARLALDVRQDENDIWVWDLVRKGLTRVTNDPGLDRAPIWSRDGEFIYYSAQQSSAGSVYRQRADGTGSAERLAQSNFAQLPISLSPKGDQLLLQQGTGGIANNDLMILPLAPPTPSSAPADQKNGSAAAVARPLVKTPKGEANAMISPDGRWLAYQTDDSGNWDIYVRPFPDVDSGPRVTVSNEGGTQPRWSPDGRELFYLSARNEMMSVRVGTGATWSSDTPQKLFDAKAYFIGGVGAPYYNYDVATDGRFLMIKPVADAASEANTTANLIVVQHWFEELKQLVPR
ncbi:MAG TPA: protein kinase [Vicinamibacterales bacterium]|nr:protein kinase [Vicinamibacterales bacterium]